MTTPPPSLLCVEWGACSWAGNYAHTQGEKIRAGIFGPHKRTRKHASGTRAHRAPGIARTQSAPAPAPDVSRPELQPPARDLTRGPERAQAGRCCSCSPSPGRAGSSRPGRAAAHQGAPCARIRAPELPRILTRSTRWNSPGSRQGGPAARGEAGRSPGPGAAATGPRSRQGPGAGPGGPLHEYTQTRQNA